MSIAILRKSVCALAASAALLAAPVAHADFIPTGYAAGSQQFGLSIGGSPSAGGFQGMWNGNPIVFWCIQLTEYFSFGTHYTNYTPSAAANSLLSKLFTVAGGSALSDASHSAAFQLAIWEIVYDSGDLHLNSGALFVTDVHGHGTTVGLAQSWLDSLAGASATANLAFLTAPGNQDFVTASTIPLQTTTTRVPEPSTLALLALAMLAAGGIRARRGRGR